MGQAAGVTRFTIRGALLADMPSLQNVFRRSSLSNVGDRASLIAHHEVLELSDVSVREGRTRVALADGGHVVGFSTIADRENVAELDDLFVHPEWMRQGVGRQLVLDAVALARDRGVRRLEVTANGHALRFYEAVGFVFDKEVETRFAVGYRMHRPIAPQPLRGHTGAAGVRVGESE
jgi:GNAT superfamily N-acetyltransferase